MKHLKIIYLLLAALVACLASCEKEVEFNSQYDDGIALYAIATPGQPFSLRISRSFSVNNNPTRMFSSYSEYYNEIDTLYHAQIVIKNATAQLVVNNTDHYTLVYNDTSPYLYTCDYTPQAGDEIAISVKAPGYKDVHASAHIEVPQQVDIVNTEVVYKHNGDDGTKLVENPLDRYGVDSVMIITMRLSDPPKSHNFYRLKVRGVANREELLFGWYIDKFYSVNDVFTSDDIIFLDNQLSKPYGDWEAGMTNVFDDHLFDGQDYTFTVETRKRYGDNARVIVELETLNADLYYFLKSYMLYRISTDDVYLTPIGLYSNIDNGWGILGTLSYDRHILYY